MEKKVAKKILAILIIMMILSADFLVLGSNLVTYALTLDNTTNHKNIEFSAYFKNGKGEKTDTLQTSIKQPDLKLYADITVKNDGYLNGALELQNSNFKIKNNILSDNISSINGNKVELKQINAGTTVTVELEIEPIITETMTADMLLKASDLKLTGKYMETSYKGLSIEAVKPVTLDLQADESAEAELETDIITNKIFNIDGTNKRVVQVLVKSRLTENQYPIKQTILKVNAPVLSEKQPEEVSVLSLGTMATNGKTTLLPGDWKNENGVVQITLKNEDSEIKWNKNVYDELIVTFIYPEDVDADRVEVVTDSEITVHNSGTTYTAKHTKWIENKEPNGIITTQAQIEQTEIYKGSIYEGIETKYNTITNLVITNADIAEKIIVKEGPDVFTTETEEMAANTKYISTEINKSKMLEILGEDGVVEIKSGDTVNKIDGNTEPDENGNIILNYSNPVNELEITTSKPVKPGMLEFRHTKAIVEGTYTREQLQTVKTIKTLNTVTGIKNVEDKETAIVENSSEANLELKETITKAELTVNKESFSTMTTNQGVIIGVKLITDGMKYDLYKNPRIRIQLPSAVENIQINSNKLYANDFTMTTNYDSANKVIEIDLNGEQTAYPETSATQAYLQLDLDITLSKFAPNAMDKIVMTYTNENGIQYDGGTTDRGVIEKAVEISSPSGLITIHNSETYNITGIYGTSEDKQVVQVLNEDAGKDVDFEIALVNNTDTNLKNVRILGTLPTSENTVIDGETNTLITTLKEVTATGGTVYYTENVNATPDYENVDNGWGTTFNANSKKFLIVLDALNTETAYMAGYKIQLPNPMIKDAFGYAQYKVIYDTDTETNLETQSVIIGFQTPTEIKLETNVTAQVGNDNINSGDTIKAGEVIKYTTTVKNNGIQKVDNIQFKSNIPEGTVVVIPQNPTSHTGTVYYIEHPETTEMVTTIPTLASGETYTVTYEVRVKSDLTEEKQISCKATAVCGEEAVESAEFTNKIVPSKLRITTKKILQEDVPVVAGGTMEYLVFVENLSAEEITNLEVEVITSNFSVGNITDGQGLFITGNDALKSLKINSIPANGIVSFKIVGEISENVDDVTAYAILKDSQGNTYRSNKIVNTLDKYSAKISLTSPQDKASLRYGEKIEYNITVENTGNLNSVIEIADKIPENLIVESIAVNGEIILQSTHLAQEDTYLKNISNDVTHRIQLEPGASATMTIMTRVGGIGDVDTKTITNKAEVRIMDVVVDVSEEVTHILKSSTGNIKNIVSGKAWLDSDRDGERDSEEQLLSGIIVRLYDIDTKDYAKDNNGNIIETTTNDKGEYTFTKIKNGKYIVLFEYDINEYEPTTYLKEGVDDSKNSKVVEKKITINGEEKTFAVTDTIILEDNVSDINIGLREKLIFDLKLDKYISRIAIQNSKRTKTYDYENSNFEKVSLDKKEINGTVVVLEYTIRVTNNGEITGYANNIVDYLSSGLTFNSELNPDWYLAGEDLYTKKLASEAINPGESKDIKLILTKTMTNDNLGVVNNRAEICDAYNEYGNSDINSTPNNNLPGENDMGTADVIIEVNTGGTIIGYIILVIVNTILIGIAIRLMIKNGIIKIKKERR